MDDRNDRLLVTSNVGYLDIGTIYMFLFYFTRFY